LWNQTSFLTTPLCQALSRNSGSEFAEVRLQHTHTRARMLGQLVYVIASLQFLCSFNVWQTYCLFN